MLRNRTPRRDKAREAKPTKWRTRATTCALHRAARSRSAIRADFDIASAMSNFTSEYRVYDVFDIDSYSL